MENHIKDMFMTKINALPNQFEINLNSKQDWIDTSKRLMIIKHSISSWRNKAILVRNMWYVLNRKIKAEKAMLNFKFCKTKKIQFIKDRAMLDKTHVHLKIFFNFQYIARIFVIMCGSNSSNKMQKFKVTKKEHFHSVPSQILSTYQVNTLFPLPAWKRPSLIKFT